MRLLVLALTSLLALSGCMQSAETDNDGGPGSHSMVITGQGTKTGTVDRSLDCGRDATLSLVLQGRGDVRVTVIDGADKTIHDNRYQDSQNVDVGTLGGAPGTWHVRVDFAMLDVAGQRVGSYEGQWSVTFAC